MRKSLNNGATLAEVMMVVVIMGILAAVAIPMFGRYLRRARSSEAAQSLERISAGAKVYYETILADVNGRPLPRQFPDTSGCGSPPCPTPASSCCSQSGMICANTSWSADVWSAVRFNISVPHYYQYFLDSAGTNTAATFTADALGNLDCDTITATWRITGNIDSNTYRPIASLPRLTTTSNDEIE